jgi:hypothetical protein
LYQFTWKAINKADCSAVGISLLITSYTILSNILLSLLSLHQILEKNWEYNKTVHQLFIAFKKAYDSVKRGVLYNILIEFGVTIKQVRLIKMYLNETYSKVCIGK